MGDGDRRQPRPDDAFSDQGHAPPDPTASPATAMSRAEGSHDAMLSTHNPLIDSRQPHGHMSWPQSLPNRGQIPPNAQNFGTFPHASPPTGAVSTLWPHAATITPVSTISGRSPIPSGPMLPPESMARHEINPVAMPIYPGVPPPMNAPHHPLYHPYHPAPFPPRHQPMFSPHTAPPFSNQIPPYPTQQPAQGFEYPQAPLHFGVKNRRAVAHPPFRSPPPSHAAPSQQLSQTRGPPRKPRQSGHALWVGNLPMGTTIVQLKDHFSRDATDDIESVKLISKSNCAFVNYKTQASCNAAVQRFNETKFLAVRLVCRLRKASASHATASSQSPPGSQPPQSKVDAKFFILKSLTARDLEESVQNNIWATQTHNEDALNAAYTAAENVYLIFSANRSGEYFGYARMESQIPAPDLNETELSRRLPSDSTHQPESSPGESSSSRPTEILDPSLPFRPQYPTHYAGPRSILTPPTEWAPRGRITDDVARETIFWEADEADQEQRRATLQQQATITAAAEEVPQHTVMTTKPSSEKADSPPREEAASETTTQRSSQPVIANSSIEQPPPAAEVDLVSESAETNASDPSRAPDAAQEVQESPSASQRTVTTGSNPQHQEFQHSHEPQPLGNPFRVSWQSTQRVPFWRTRGLKNSLNGNREVKIARDGTEVEPGIGEKLLLLFAVQVPVGNVSSPPAADNT